MHDCAQLAETPTGLIGQNAGQRGFTNAGRSEQNDRTESICFQQPPQQFAFAEDMLLPNKLVQVSRAHP